MEKEKKVRVGVWTPEDFQDIKVRTGQSSIAGAGSGEFHMYNERTRRERERLAKMAETDQQKRAREEFEKKQEEHRRADEERTAKKRAKRQKRKQADQKKESKPEQVVAGGEGKKESAGEKKESVFGERGSLSGGGGEASLSSSVRVRWVSRREGEAQREFVAETSAICLVAVEGYSLYKFRDVAGDVRESMATRLGDYMLCTAQVPTVWESVSASQLLSISVAQSSAPALPSFASGYAPQHEGLFFAGGKSLAPDGSLRKLFPVDVCFSSLTASGEHGKGLAAQMAHSAVIIIRGKASVTCAGETCLLGGVGEFVVCPPHEQVTWMALAPNTVVLALVLPRY